MENLVEGYLATWNETDHARRAERLRAVFLPDASYEDPLMRGVGLEQIDGLIRAVQVRFPGYRFTRFGTVGRVGDCIRFSWRLAPEAGPAIAAGTDFAEIAAGHFRRVVGFLEEVPA